LPVSYFFKIPENKGRSDHWCDEEEPNIPSHPIPHVEQITVMISLLTMNKKTASS